jgi:hypothetical protein
MKRRFWWGKLKKRYIFEGAGGHKRIILKHIQE